MNCKICDQKTKPIFHATILNKYPISYFHCDQCGFIQTEEPYWLTEAYQESINLSDTGIMQRNLLFAEKSAAILYYLFDHTARFLDYAGGYGIFTRLMRDMGFDFCWHDPYTNNLFARGFEYPATDSKIELVTSFESFEHFVQPMADIQKMLAISNHILFSTQILLKPVPEPETWWYYGLEHGQHIAFYSLKTLAFIAEKNGLNFCTNGSFLHLFTSREISNRQFNRVLKNSKKIRVKIKQRMPSKINSDMEYMKALLARKVDENII